MSLITHMPHVPHLPHVPHMHVPHLWHPDELHPYYPRTYEFLEVACMSREMDRL